MMFRRRTPAVSQDEISTMIGDIASLVRQLQSPALNDSEKQLIHSNIESANKVLQFLLDEMLAGK